MTLTLNDIYGYTVFANIDKRNGKIAGHRMILTPEQMAVIEDVIASGDLKVIEEPTYEVIECGS